MSKIIQIEDISRFKNVGEVKISPDGKYVAYTVRTTVVEENKSNVDLFVSSISVGEIKKLNVDGKASLIAWSPDGKWISYVQGDKDGNNIMIVDVNSGFKRKICTYNVSNASLGIGCVGDMVIWSPDSTKLAYLGSLEPIDKEAKIKVINRIMYRAFFGNRDVVAHASRTDSPRSRALTSRRGLAWDCFRAPPVALALEGNCRRARNLTAHVAPLI